MQYKMFDCSRAGEMDIFIAEVFTRFVGMSKKKSMEMLRQNVYISSIA